MKNTLKRYRVILMGSRPLSMRILKFFLKRKDIDLVSVIASDKGHKGWWRGSLYGEALKHKIRISTQEDIKKLNPDVIFSVNYTQIIDKGLTEKFRIINTHSLLPRYRGRNAVSWAIINARKDNYWKFGASLHEIDESLDTGPIIATSYFDIEEDDTAYTLYKKWEKHCFSLIKKMLPHLLSGNYKTFVQKGKSYYYSKDSIKNKEISLSWSKDEIYDGVRAYTFPPYERPYIRLHNRRIYLIFDQK